MSGAGKWQCPNGLTSYRRFGMNNVGRYKWPSIRDRAKSGNPSGGAYSSAPEPACGPENVPVPEDDVVLGEGKCNGTSSGGETDDPDYLGHRALLIIALMSELSRTLLFEVPPVRNARCEARGEGEAERRLDDA